jgi:ATP-dependent DNA helicase RecG
MLNHGLDKPLLGTDTGYFQVVFPGPGDNIERIRVPEARLLVTPSVEASLNQRQKEMVVLLLEGKELTSRECETRFGVTRPVVSRELGNLVELGVAVRVGAGRSIRYRLKSETLFVK